tara:strand:+ start:5787 stop:8036 length:2250 start_codon:yes stop_codon:yes gene_type:complete
MVLSQINDTITYPEIKSIDENDKGKEVTMFQLNLLGVDVVIAIGDIKYDFAKNDILFVPVYLIVDEQNKIYQIGVYEFANNEYENLLDSDGDLNISKIDGPLLYTFVDKSYLEKCMVNESLVQDFDSGDEEDIDDLDDDEVSDDEELDDEKNEEKESENPSRLLVELDIEENKDDDDFLQVGETEKTDKKERKEYKKPDKGESEWIQQFMQNNNYKIENVASDGSCFFYVVRNAFKSIGINATVDKLRQFLADNVTQEQFDNYKTTYDMYMAEYRDLRQQIPTLKSKKTELTKKFKSIKTKSKKEKDRDTLKSLTKVAKKTKQEHLSVKTKLEKFKNEMTYVKENIKNVEWMKNIKTLDDLKAFMLSCDFWADAWAIPKLEILINTKIIILSSEFYKKGQYTRVVNCGSFTPKEIEDIGYFKPKYYIIAEHTGNHYKLVGYKNKKIFRFHEIPYKLKNMLVEQCMKSSGKSIYNYIPKFAKLIGETIDVSKRPEGEKEDFLESMSKRQEDKKSKIEEVKEKLGMSIEEEEVEMQPTPTPEDENLFNDNTIFVFYSKSANKKPGKGKGETIPDDRLIEFNELAKMKDWRKVLSNFYMKPKRDGEVVPLFELDGLKWASVEHYYHANKFKKNHPDYYRLFSIDSGSQIMDDPKKALGAGGKTGKVSGKKFRPKNVVMDEDFFDDNNNEEIMEKGQMAKYQQDDISRQVLLATKDAKLVHYTSSRKSKADRPPNVVFYDTMRIRHRLKRNKK